MTNTSSGKPAPSVRHSIKEITGTDDPRWEVFARGEGFIEGINFDSDGIGWMVGYMEGRILKIVDGKSVTVGPRSGFPNGARFSPDGRLFIADRTNGIQVVDKVTGERTTLFTQYVASVFRGLNDLMFDSYGGLYFTEPYGSNAIEKTGRVFYVAPEEKAQPEIFAAGIGYPNGVAVSADGQRVYIAEYGQNRILSIPSRRSSNIFEIPFVFAWLEGGIGPDGLQVDSEGNLYAAQFAAGQVSIFDASGFPYGSIRLPEGAMHFTTNLALHDGYLYVTEALQNIVWRLPITKKPLSGK